MEHETRMALQTLTNAISTLTDAVEQLTKKLENCTAAAAKLGAALEWKPALGDVVKIAVSGGCFFSVGAIGKLVQADGDLWQIDFNNFGNPPGSYKTVHGGAWWAKETAFVKHTVEA